MIDQNKFLKESRERLSAMTDQELIERFNKATGHSGWTSTRATFVSLVHEEFDKRGFDYSLIGDENGLSYARKIKLDGKTISVVE